MQPALHRLRPARRPGRRAWSATAAACALACVALTLLAPAAASAAGPSHSFALHGTFKLTPGRCNASSRSVTGSYFRLVFPGGSVTSGRFFVNANSVCSDKTYTLLSPGSQGGLQTAAYQPDPTPAFTPNGSAAADAIVTPVSFTGVDLSLATNATDRQTRRAVPEPQIITNGGLLLGQVEAFSAAWDKIFFNQGSPKPGGRDPGLTTGFIGRYNAHTHAFTMSWTSQIVGGRFSGFAGYWHLTGTFQGTESPVTVATPATTPSRTPRTTTTAPKPPSSRAAPRASVHLINCGKSSGGWSAGGTVRNPTGRKAIYHITVLFTAPAGALLASSTAVVPLPAGGAELWSTSASFDAPATVRCVLGSVTTT